MPGTWIFVRWSLDLLCSSFPFLVSKVTPGYVLTSKDLELGASDKRELMKFVFLGLGYFSQYDLF